uniref:DUF6824 domain-containing protein n=1 Tax=Cyclophora tenuis TaxID=216820 RepID=A0A7S1D3Z7_CYCTE|mmetsp:Transcript_19749/g.33727  ORF Transcript_19749/g.33727 Transcript_19749/m.33727 type:complete len:162 (+) Transcript_19749:38-523(+)
MDNDDLDTARNNNLHRIRNNDILCSTIPRYAAHVGNQDFNLVLSAYLLHRRTVALERVEERVGVARDVVQMMRQRQSRFLAKTRRGTWKDIGDDLAVRWISRRLRRMVENDGNDDNNNNGNDDDDDDNDNGLFVEGDALQRPNNNNDFEVDVLVDGNDDAN